MRRPARMAALAATSLLAATAPVSAHTAGDPIKLVFQEGDVAGFSTIYAAGGGPIGFIEYRQTRRGDVLSSVRVARFRDGSSDEDRAEARVSNLLVALSGRSIIRDTDGETIVDLSIDVAGGHIRGSWGRGARRQRIDDETALPPGTYWGPLIFIVLKNFAANAEDDRVVFRTVAPTPKPRVLDMELVRVGPETVERLGAALETVRFDLRPTIHWLLDPIIHQFFTPQTSFYLMLSKPPALARYTGPRNYAGERIRIE